MTRTCMVDGCEEVAEEVPCARGWLPLGVGETVDLYACKPHGDRLRARSADHVSFAFSSVETPTAEN